MDTHMTGSGGNSWRNVPPFQVFTHQRDGLSTLPPELAERAFLRRLAGTDRMIRRDQFLALVDLLVSLGVVPRGAADLFLSEMASRYGLIAECGHPVFAVLPEILEDEVSALRLPE